MTEELYDPVETKSALAALDALLKRLPNPYLVLGGWAVYLTVDESYRREHGVSYLGSRDVDVCFHVDPTADPADLRGSPLAKAFEVARDLGYVPTGSFRFCKFIRKGTGEVLTEEQSKHVPAFDIHNLFLDMMVDRIHPRHSEVFGSRALDEPLVAGVFQDGFEVRTKLGGIEVPVPPAHILLATKLKSIQGRNREDKVVKDACDIYALLWHSKPAYSDVLSRVRDEFPEECDRGVSAITVEIARTAARHLCVDEDSYQGVVQGLRRKVA
jgi:hypothetical protein